MRKVKSNEPRAHYCRCLSRFLKHEATRIIATPPGWDASPSQITPSISPGFPDGLPVLLYTHGWREALGE